MNGTVELNEKQAEANNNDATGKVSFQHDNPAFVSSSNQDLNQSGSGPLVLSPVITAPDNNDPETRCGLCCCHPDCLQKAVHRIPLIIFLCGIVVSQSLMETGLLSSINTTLEKRFQLKTQQVGYIITVYEAVSVFCTFFISYFGHKSNRARLIGAFGLLIMIGYIIFLLPHFINDDYKPKISLDNKCELNPADRRNNNCDSSINPNIIALGIFCAGQVMCAIGASPIYVLGPTYLWDNLTAKQYPIYGSFIYVCAALGPAMGFVFGGIFLDMYIDTPKSPPKGLTSSQSEWLGAWWIGIFLSIGLVIIAAIPLMFFPRKFPRHLVEKEIVFEDQIMKKSNEEVKKQRQFKANERIAAIPERSAEEVESEVDPSLSPEEVEPVFIFPFVQRSASNVQERSRKISNLSESRDTSRVRRMSELSTRRASVQSNTRRHSLSVSNPNIVKNKNKIEGLGNLGDIKDLPRALYRVLSNKIWLGITGVTIVENLIANAFIIYVSKYLQSMFRVPASKASFMTGGVIVPSAVLGIIFGGFLMRRKQYTVNGAAKFILVLCCLTTALTIGLMFLSCSTPLLVGTNINYNTSRTIEKSPQFLPKEFTNLTHKCNSACGCTNYVYDPICGGETNDNYFSPCYAGCKGMKTFTGVDGTTIKNYTDCDCVSSTYAIEGICQSNCNTLYYALVLVFFQVLLTSMGLMPANIITLKAASADDSSFALGSQLILVRLLAFIPAPILFGYVFDSMCLFRSQTCAEEGACLEYDLSKLAYIFLGTLSGLKFLGIIFALLTWFLSKNIEVLDFAENEEAMNVKDGEMDSKGITAVSYIVHDKSADKTSDSNSALEPAP